MARALILDLDDTLVDSSALAVLRNQKNWRQCAASFSRTQLFAGFVEAIHAVRAEGVSIGIVTASVSYYAGGLLKHHGVESDALIAFHDCSPRKPHPAPIAMCLRKLGCEPSGSLGIGDASVDAEAYAAAGMTAWGAGWSPALDRDAAWDEIISHPKKIARFFKN